MPIEMAVISPVVLTDAIAVLLLLHVPPVVVAVQDVVAPVHMALVPLMVPATGSGLTVIGAVAVAAPQLPETM